MTDEGTVTVDLQRLVDIIREENPMVFELAVRRATIEALREQLAARNGQS